MEGVQRRRFVRFDKKIVKMTGFLKTYEILGNIQPRVQALSPKVCNGVLLSIRIRIKHILKVCNVVFWINSMKNCQSYRLL